MNLLTVSGLSKQFGARAVLRNVSFSVRRGEVLGLIGPNGAGKTTLFEYLAGVLPSDGGALSTNEQRLAPARRKDALFYLPDGVTPWAQQSVNWALDFIAAGRGGWLAALATYTPTAALRFFERGLLRLSVVFVMSAMALGGLAIAAIWLHTGRRLGARLLRTAFLLGLIAVAVWLGSLSRASWDANENRRNSFSRADEAALRRIRGQLRVTINLAAEDPRLMDYERGILNKLRRILPRLEVDYAAQSRTGLFEGAGERYGEIWYELGGRRVMNRSTTEPIVVEQLYQLAGITAPANSDEPVFPGHPLAAHPKGASLVFYALWPLAVISAWGLARHRRK